MGLFQIAIANLKVRKIKTFFLLLGISLCLANFVALYTATDSLQEQLEQQLRKSGFRFLITPINEQVSASYQGVLVGEEEDFQPSIIPQDYLEGLQKLDLPGLDIISPKLILATEIAGKDVLVSGLQFKQEKELQDWWNIQAGRLPERQGEILLGKDTAVITGLQVGSKADVFGETFEVTGILAASGRAEDRLIFLELKELQLLTGIQGLSFVELRVQAADGQKEIGTQGNQLIKTIKERLSRVNVAGVKDENIMRQGLIEEFIRFSIITAIVIAIISWLVIAVVIMASVNERTKEIGVFRSIGYRKKQIMAIILWEAGIISSSGGLLGYLLGAWVGSLLVSFFDGGVGVGIWKLQGMIIILGFSLLIGLSAAFYPALRAAQLDPVEALY